MASISTDKQGNRRILFLDANNHRRTIYLGRIPMRATEAIKRRVEELAAAHLTQHPLTHDTAEWLAELNDTLAEKLAAVGLIPKRERRQGDTVAAFIDNYIIGRTDVKPLTLRNLRAAEREIVKFFGKQKRLIDVTPGDADEFRRKLLETLGDNTVRRICGRARQFFRAAIRKRMIRENPFGDMKGIAVRENRARDFYVTRAMAQQVIDACPDNQWRLLFALSRYGGLRCPSEHLALRWTDVNWEQGRIRVPSPKTEAHEGGESREIPIFPELRPHLEAVWFDPSQDGAEFIITRYREKNCNLRTQLQRIIKRAGLECWPKLFHNLRATRQTELAETFPAHVVCDWLGNSQAVAARHYLQVTDEHFAEAMTTRIPTQQLHAGTSNGTPEENGDPSESKPLQGFASQVVILQGLTVPPRGVEPLLPD